MGTSWNPWHGCRKWSAGCANCYVYRIDARHGRDPSVVTRTQAFDLPVRRKRTGAYKLPSGNMVFTCFSSDFFIQEADEWRAEAWSMIRKRPDLHFFIITKRIDRFYVSLPDDWVDGYDNVTVCCTVENQDRADFRLPLYREAPIRHKMLACEPLLTSLDLSCFLGPWLKAVVAGGESGPEARICCYEWIQDIRRQCVEAGVAFSFKQTGANFSKNGKVYKVPRRLQHSQARKAGINTASLSALWTPPPSLPLEDAQLRLF